MGTKDKNAFEDPKQLLEKLIKDFDSEFRKYFSGAYEITINSPGELIPFIQYEYKSNLHNELDFNINLKNNHLLKKAEISKDLDEATTCTVKQAQDPDVKVEVYNPLKDKKPEEYSGSTTNTKSTEDESKFGKTYTYNGEPLDVKLSGGIINRT